VRTDQLDGGSRTVTASFAVRTDQLRHRLDDDDDGARRRIEDELSALPRSTEDRGRSPHGLERRGEDRPARRRIEDGLERRQDRTTTGSRSTGSNDDRIELDGG
jgi:hypothetical protein